MAKRTIVYIDGFNFYYGCIKGTPHRWLDLSRLSRILLPKNDVRKVKYFTAVVKPTKWDQSKHIRQLTYLRALRTIPEIQVYLGSFQSHNVRRPKTDGTGVVEVIDTKEKGSDVNLATEMLVDAFSNRFDVAVVISNDSDLVAPIRAVTTIGKPVGVISPYRTLAAELRKSGSFFKQIRRSALKRSQLPSTLSDAQGTFHKPNSW